MGRRSVLPSFEVVAPQDGASSFDSDSTEVESVDVVGYDVKLTGNLLGELVVQYSNERNENEAIWKDLAFGQSLILDASIDQDNRLQIETSFKRLRLSWTYTSGAGSFAAKIYGIVRGA